MKSRIERFIPEALNYFMQNRDNFLTSKKDGYDKVYNGYLASFGPSVITAGIKTTIMFYEGDNKKKKINEAISSLLSKELNKEIQLINFINSEEFLKNELYFRELILDIIIALKLSYRSFELKENDD